MAYVCATNPKNSTYRVYNVQSNCTIHQHTVNLQYLELFRFTPQVQAIWTAPQKWDLDTSYQMQMLAMQQEQVF